MNKVDDLDLIAAQPIDEPIALNEEFADVRIVFFWNNSAPLSELPKGTSCVAGLSHQSCCVPW